MRRPCDVHRRTSASNSNATALHKRVKFRGEVLHRPIPNMPYFSKANPKHALGVPWRRPSRDQGSLEVPWRRHSLGGQGAIQRRPAWAAAASLAAGLGRYFFLI